MVTVGITGGIGSGKTEVCNVWESLGAYVLNADELAKRIMVEDAEVREVIKVRFGPESYKDDGSLNKPYLADEAFRKGRVDELNAIVHPRIPDKSRRIMEKARSDGYQLFIYEAALLFENLRPDFLDYTVLILADREKRISRVQERDGVAAENVTDRMARQQEFEKLTHLADYVIYNNGSLDELKTEAEALYREWVEQ